MNKNLHNRHAYSRKLHKLEEPFDAAAWDKMRQVLDAEMPQKPPRRRRPVWLPLLLLASLGIGLGGYYYLSQPGGAAQHAANEQAVAKQQQQAQAGATAPKHTTTAATPAQAGSDIAGSNASDAIQAAGNSNTPAAQTAAAAQPYASHTGSNKRGGAHSSAGNNTSLQANDGSGTAYGGSVANGISAAPQQGSNMAGAADIGANALAAQKSMMAFRSGRIAKAQFAEDKIKALTLDNFKPGGEQGYRSAQSTPARWRAGLMASFIAPQKLGNTAEQYGFGGGAYIERDISSRFSLHTGLQYSVFTGKDYTAYSYIKKYDTYSYETRSWLTINTTHYLQMPFLLQASLVHGLQLEAGVQGGLLTYTVGSLYGTHFNRRPVYGITSTLRTFDAGLVAGLRYNRGPFGAGIRYCHGLVDVTPDPYKLPGAQESRAVSADLSGTAFSTPKDLNSSFYVSLYYNLFRF